MSGSYHVNLSFYGNVVVKKKMQITLDGSNLNLSK
jgi:hypothetical protein